MVVRDAHKKLSGSLFSLALFGLILPLRALPQCNPFDLLSDWGTTSGQLPVYAAVHDHLVEKGVNRRGVLCITFSMQDLLSLRAVGMPAALAVGLEEITRNRLRNFAIPLGLRDRVMRPCGPCARYVAAVSCHRRAGGRH